MSIPKEFFDGLAEGLKDKAALDERDDDATTWEPENDGDMVKGIFTKVSFVADKYNPGTFKPVVVIKDIETGENVNVWGSRKVLKDQLIEAHPLPGTGIGIRYSGFVATPDKDFDGYHLYAVIISDRTPEEAAEGLAHWRAAAVTAQEAPEPTPERVAPVGPKDAPF